MNIPQNRFHMLLRGHVLDKLRELPDESVDCIMTSPPYYGLRMYRGAESIWGGDPNCEHDFSNAQPADLLHENRNNRKGTQEEVMANPTGTTYVRRMRGQPHRNTAKVGNTLNDAQPPEVPLGAVCPKCHAWRGQLGLEPDYRAYLAHLLMVTAELKRVLKKTGTLWWNMADSYSGKPTGAFNGGGVQFEGRDTIGIESSGQIDKTLSGIPAKSLMLMPERFAMRMVDEQGWVLRNFNVWFKISHMPSSVSDRLANSYEFVMFFTKAQRYSFDLDAIRVPLSPVTLKEIEKPYNGNSLKDYGSAMAQDASESKKRIVKSLQKYRSGNKERKVEQFRLSHLGSSIPWSAEDSPAGKNPGDVLHYDSKYAKDEYGRLLQGAARDQSIVEARQKSREDAVRLFPNDPEKQQEYINFVHDHNTHPQGKNPGDVVDFFREKGSGGNYDYGGINSEDASHYHELGKNPGDFWEINPTPHRFSLLLADYIVRDGKKLIPYRISADCPIHSHLKASQKNGAGQSVSVGDITVQVQPATSYRKGSWGGRCTCEEIKTDHFAVFPTELCYMPIKAGCPSEICTECGKAKEKIIQSNSNWEFRKQKGATGGAMVMGAKQQIGKGWSHDLYSSAKVAGYTDCGCNAPFRPGIVLDPFAGSGTTGVAARQLGRSSIMIEVSSDYCEILKKRMEWGQQSLDGTEWIE